MPTATANDSTALPPDDDMQAAEYVLGLLDEVSRRRAAMRLADDPAFARLVAEWELRFSPWLLRAPEAAPSPHTWDRIRERLGWRGQGQPARGLWDNAVLWRRAAGIALVAGIVAAMYGVTRTPPAPVPVPEELAARPVTVLARDDGSVGWIARIDTARGEVLMVPVPAAADASGRVNELWIIPAGGKPRSLGFVSHDKAHTLAVPPELRPSLAVGATLAITLEDQAGIPHVAPSSQPVAVGNIRTI